MTEWSQWENVPAMSSPPKLPPPFAKAVFNTGFVAGMLLIFARQIHPVAWAIIIVVLSFTLAMILPGWLYAVYAVAAIIFAAKLYRENDEA